MPFQTFICGCQFLYLRAWSIKYSREFFEIKHCLLRLTLNPVDDKLAVLVLWISSFRFRLESAISSCGSCRFARPTSSSISLMIPLNWLPSFKVVWVSMSMTARAGTSEWMSPAAAVLVTDCFNCSISVSLASNDGSCRYTVETFVCGLYETVKDHRGRWSNGVLWIYATNLSYNKA